MIVRVCLPPKNVRLIKTGTFYCSSLLSPSTQNSAWHTVADRQIFGNECTHTRMKKTAVHLCTTWAGTGNGLVVFKLLLILLLNDLALITNEVVK